MDSIEFEYIDFNSENISQNCETLSQQDETKCGSVFVTCNYEYTFICEFCNDRFSDLLNFGIHYQSSHSNDTNSTKPALESTVPTPKEYCEEEHPMPIIKAQSPLLMEDDESEPEPEIPEIYEATVNETQNEDAPTKKPSKDTMRFFCEICGRSYCSKSSYNHHKKKHDRIRKLRSKSNKSTVTKPKTIEADEDSTNPGKTTLKTAPTPYCDLCNRSFRQPLKFRQHGDIFHADRPPKQLQADPSYFACIYCRKTFETVADRIEHEQLHIDESKPFACSFCSLTFETNNRREMHERLHTGVRPYQCPYCPKRFYQKYPCDVHVSTHTGDMKYPCQYCDKRFALAEVLKSHVRIHTLERPFQCEECGKKYRHRSNLAEHRKRHTNDRKSKCDICYKMFYTNRELRNHQTAHSKERPFECETCGRTFQLKKFLVTHRKLHADFKEHECHICHARFAQRAGLYVHKKSNHGENLI